MYCMTVTKISMASLLFSILALGKDSLWNCKLIDMQVKLQVLLFNLARHAPNFTVMSVQTWYVGFNFWHEACPVHQPAAKRAWKLSTNMLNENRVFCTLGFMHNSAIDTLPTWLNLLWFGHYHTAVNQKLPENAPACGAVIMPHPLIWMSLFKLSGMLPLSRATLSAIAQTWYRKLL